MPVFSVVIPLYNKQNYIAATLQSVLAQTFADFEVLVVNDVATDNSLAVAQQFTDPRISVVSHDVNKGLSASRNTGIKRAQGTYVAFLDADDTWHPHFLETIYQLTLNYPEADMFATKYEEVYPGNVVIEHPFRYKNGLLDNFFERALQKPVYCPSSLCVRTSAFAKTGLYNETITMGEDVDFNVRAHLACRMAYSDKPLVRYTMVSQNQIMHSSMHGKTIIDHDFYEKAYPERKDLKKNLDFHRYTMAKRYRLAGDRHTCNKLIKAIDPANLNHMQRLLLHAPAFVLRLIGKIKGLLVKKGLNPTTY